MTVASFVLSAVALLVSGSAFGWQVLSWFLSGGRVKVNLLQGAVGREGILIAPSMTAETMGQLRRQGYEDPAVIVEVHNAGRLPVYVQQWKLSTDQTDYLPTGGFLHGPPLPHKIEAGERVSWALHGWQVDQLIAATRLLASNDELPEIVADVTLASGVTKQGRGRIDLRGALGQRDRGDADEPPR
jgi:hypothetical protein